MSEFTFVEVSDQKARKQHHWPSVIVPRKAIDAEIERLASIERPESGRRATSVSHPANTGPVPALAPGPDRVPDEPRLPPLLPPLPTSAVVGPTSSPLHPL